MILRIEIKTDNAAFEENAKEEALRIINKYLNDIDMSGHIAEKCYVRDINGNKCGIISYTTY